MNGSFTQAENRVRELNDLTRRCLERSRRPDAPAAVVSVPRFEAVNEQPPVPETSPHKCSCGCKNDPSPLDKLFKGADGERLLIIALIIVLINEGADIKLIIALMYLIL